MSIATEQPEESVDANARTEEPESSDSDLESQGSIRIVGDMLVTAIRASKDAAELTAVLVREELEAFSSCAVRRILGLVVGGVGFVLVSAGLVLGLREWILPWSLSLLTVGSLDLAVAWRLAKSMTPDTGPDTQEG